MSKLSSYAWGVRAEFAWLLFIYRLNLVEYQQVYFISNMRDML